MPGGKTTMKASKFSRPCQGQKEGPDPNCVATTGLAREPRAENEHIRTSYLITPLSMLHLHCYSATGQ